MNHPILIGELALEAELEGAQDAYLDALEAVALWRSGLSIADIARHFDLSHRDARALVRRGEALDEVKTG